MFNKGNTKLRNISNGRQRQVNETWNVRLKQESEETQTQRTMIRKRPRNKYEIEILTPTTSTTKTTNSMTHVKHVTKHKNKYISKPTRT